MKAMEGAIGRMLDIQSAEYMITPPPGMVSLRQFAGWDVVQSDGVTSRENHIGPRVNRI